MLNTLFADLGFLDPIGHSVLLGGLIAGFVLLVGFGLGRRGPAAKDAPSLTPTKPPPPPENEDKRQVFRRCGGNIAVLVTDGDGKSQPRTAWIKDRTPHGLGFIADKGETEGVVLRVRPKDAGENIPWVKVVVRNCREQGHQFEIGCQYLQPPSSSILMYFG